MQRGKEKVMEAQLVKEKIIIADDVEINRELLKDIFEEQFDIVEAADGLECLEALKDHPDAALLFLDLVMPGKSGLEVLKSMEENGQLEMIPVIMITGEATQESDLKAYEYGVSEIIHKPFEPNITMRRAQNVMELYKQRNNMAREIEKKSRELEKANERIHKNNNFLLNALGSVVEFRSAESGEHVVRVSEYTKVLLNHVRKLYPEYGLTKEQIEEMSQAAALHDLGKIAIPDAILNAPRKLTREEFATMKQHTIFGCEILEKFKTEDTPFYQYCYNIIRWHHEKDDGKGYPDGLKGDEIPIYVQACGIADCYDALVSKRVYKDAYTTTEAYDTIVKGECGKFSDKILEAFEAAKFEFFVMTDKFTY